MNKQKTILVVEDEPPLIEVIKVKLEQHGLKVTVASTIKEALHKLENSGTFSAIWLDHYLPGKESGLDFVVKLKSEESKWKKLPIFVVSNTASNHNITTYRELGVSKYYVKAVHRLDDIIKEIKPLIK